MATTNTTNGRQRKNLADQIDRLDSILDGLSEGLNEAVATAVEQAVATAVQEAVKQAVTEVLTNAELQRLLHPPAPQPPGPPPPGPPPAPGKGGLLQGVLGLARRTWSAARSAAGSVWSHVQAVGRGAGQIARAGVERARRGTCALYALLLTSRVAKAVGVGGIAATVCYASGPVAGVLGNLARALPGLLNNAVASVVSFFHGG
jgi:hypothetical protein